ncbi:MAG TPA: GNAT family N-acetyltransferase [Candidatus Polarisedimenticolia bacterium]|nr:GNAT family N-acetyltransferase [Candidatus Polarisedimenticolia bacterium]
MERSVSSRRATDQDLEAVTETLTLAFADDPVWGGWAFPDRGHATEQRRAFFGLWLKSSLRNRWLRVTERCKAVAAWFPPGVVESTGEEARRLVFMAENLLGGHAGVFLKGADLFEASHPRDRTHYYLSLLGTHDNHRGKGLGMGLLRENLALIDAENMPSYLESTNPGNLSRYERLGFAKIDAFTLPGGGPRVDTMWREPGGRTLPAARA